METKNGTLKLYEALELRSDYAARIATIKDCLAGKEHHEGRLSLWREDKSKRHPSPDFKPVEERGTLRALEFKQRKLNSAIQKANLETRIEQEEQEINLLEGLELRKALNAQIAELKTATVDAAHQTVIYKEGRDIVEASTVSYSESRQQLEAMRRAFTGLNRTLRRASFETTVEYADER